jgi:regulator of nucleoside diphosphate kinase
MQTFAQERLLTELDHVRLTKLIERAQRDAVLAHPNAEIEDLLDGAEVVPARQIAADVVTMYSQVELLDADSAARSRLTLCYPADADPPAGFVSVLSPVGAALLGLRVGALARWREPSGRARAARVLGIVFQPEASGDYTT